MGEYIDSAASQLSMRVERKADKEYVIPIQVRIRALGIYTGITIGGMPSTGLCKHGMRLRCGMADPVRCGHVCVCGVLQRALVMVRDMLFNSEHSKCALGRKQVRVPGNTH